MESEHKVLTYIQQQKNATQRDIANNTGVSLGKVNILIKKMIKTGLVKIERINAKSLRYMITPKGIKEKTERTYNYIKHSYNHITTVTSAVEKILNSPQLQNNQNIYLYGPHNEIYQILKLALQNNKQIKYTELTDKTLPNVNNHDTIIIWSIEQEETLPAKYKTINILKNL